MIGKNNPLNIRYSRLNKWKGQTGQTRGFCDFESVDYCIRACAILLMRSYRKRGIFTYGEIIRVYAPSCENDTGAYLEYVCEKLGVTPFDTPTSIEDFSKLIYWMGVYESGDDFTSINFNHILYIELVIENFEIKAIRL